MLLDGCIHYGTRFEKREPKEEVRVVIPPLYRRLRRHFPRRYF